MAVTMECVHRALSWKLKDRFHRQREGRQHQLHFYWISQNLDIIYYIYCSWYIICSKGVTVDARHHCLMDLFVRFDFIAFTASGTIQSCLVSWFWSPRHRSNCWLNALSAVNIFGQPRQLRDTWSLMKPRYGSGQALLVCTSIWRTIKSIHFDQYLIMSES